MPAEMRAAFLSADCPEQRKRRAELFAYESVRRALDRLAEHPRDDWKAMRLREIYHEAKNEWWRCYTRLHP